MGTQEIHNSLDVIDSRSIIARIEDLELLLDDEDIDRSEYSEEIEELAALKELTEEAEGYSPDWRYGATLIRDSYFTEYAEQFADDIGAVDRNANWPLTHIDWDAAADELKQDYTCVDFDGVEYWVR